MKQSKLPLRAIGYVDGFNLYFGLRAAGLRDCYWLDIPQLMRRYLPPGATMECVRYFTSRVSAPAEKAARQNEYIEALEAQPGLSLHFGQYMEQQRACRECKHVWTYYGEKMTDVNIASQMLVDGFRDRLDLAMLVSADSDLHAPISILKEELPDKRVWVLFPPHRGSNHLAKLAHETRRIRGAVLRECQLPDTVVGRDGTPRVRPRDWRSSDSGEETGR